MKRKRARKTSFSGKLPPIKQANIESRPREYLTEKEVERLIGASKKLGRYPLRDSTLILLSYRHGLRVSEAINLTWDMVELDSGRLHVRRLKKGTPSVHPLRALELRALRALKKVSRVFLSFYN